MPDDFPAAPAFILPSGLTLAKKRPLKRPPAEIRCTLSEMNRISSPFHARAFRLALLAALLLAGCSSLRPVRSIPTAAQREIFRAPTLALPSATPPPPQPTRASAGDDCHSLLSFVSDVTVPDGSTVKAGAEIDKRWEVENSGSCDWDARYHLRLISGQSMGAAEEQQLFPALAGKRAVIRILFTAPDEPGRYRSAWQAAGPDGRLFGDMFFVEVVVEK